MVAELVDLILSKVPAAIAPEAANIPLIAKAEIIAAESVVLIKRECFFMTGLIFVRLIGIEFQLGFNKLLFLADFIGFI